MADTNHDPEDIAPPETAAIVMDDATKPFRIVPLVSLISTAVAPIAATPAPGTKYTVVPPGPVAGELE